MGGLTKQCSSGVPNSEPQLAAGPEPQDRPGQHQSALPDSLETGKDGTVETVGTAATPADTMCRLGSWI